MTEQWLPVVGWENLYEVSDQGQVRSLGRVVAAPYGTTRTTVGKVLKLRVNKRGYRDVMLQGGGRRPTRRAVHRLVLEAFVGPCPDGMVSCHGPAGNADNTVGNLRWDTQSENVRDQLRHGTHHSGATEEACGRGHAYTPENTYWSRQCRTCNSRKATGMTPVMSIKPSDNQEN